MKYLTGILLLLMMQTASATICSNNFGSWVKVTNSTKTFGVRVLARPNESGVVLDGFNIVCANESHQSDPENFTDVFHTSSSVPLVPGPKFGDYNMAMLIKGVYYSKPPLGLHLVSLRNTAAGRSGQPLNTRLFIDNKGRPGKPIEIRAGDILADITVRKTTTYPGASVDFTIRLQAMNDLIFVPSSCTINGNRPIEVDFGRVDPVDIGDNPLSSAIQKNVTLSYYCPDIGVTTPIILTLEGSAASFNANAIAMTHKDLGASLIRRGVVVRPGSSFTSQLSGSVGSDEVTFSLIRRAGTHPDAGVYNGSATLVMALP